MAAVLLRLSNLNLPQKIAQNVIISVRKGHHLRGLPPGVARSIKQRLEGIVFLNIYKKNNISRLGFYRTELQRPFPTL